MKRPTTKPKKRRPWSKEDIQALKTMVREKIMTTVIARRLERTPNATRAKASDLGVKLAGKAAKPRSRAKRPTGTG